MEAGDKKNDFRKKFFVKLLKSNVRLGILESLRKYQEELSYIRL